MDRYTLYVDESGASNLNDHRDEFFILTGIIIKDDVNQGFSKYFQLIKEKHRITLDRNFHSVDFYEIKQSEEYVSNKMAKDFSYAISDILDTVPMKIISYSIDKKLLRRMLKIPMEYDFKDTSKEHKADKEIAYELLARKIFFDFAKFLKDKDSIGHIVAESRRESDVILLKSFFDCKTPSFFVDRHRFESHAKYFNKKVVSMCFENKNATTAGLEIADMVSYTLYLHIRGKLQEKMFQSRGLKNIYKILSKKIKQPTNTTKTMVNNIGRDRINKIAKQVKEILQNKQRKLSLGKSSSLVDPT